MPHVRSLGTLHVRDNVKSEYIFEIKNENETEVCSTAMEPSVASEVGTLKLKVDGGRIQ